MKQFRTTVRCALASPWGAMTLVAHEDALVWVGFDGQKHAPDTSQWPVSTTHPVLRMAADELQQYFAGERSQFDVPVDLGRGTPFQQSVWTALQGIEPGATTSYGAISQSIGNPKAVRAAYSATVPAPMIKAIAKNSACNNIQMPAALKNARTKNNTA